MSILSPLEIAAHARQAGFGKDQLVTMTAIPLAESGGNTRAHNNKYPDDSYGHNQINMIGALGPERRALLGLQSNSELWDPAINARAAKAIYDQQGFKAWSVYTSGKYRDFLPQAQAAVARLLGGEVPSLAAPSTATSVPPTVAAPAAVTAPSTAAVPPPVDPLIGVAGASLVDPFVVTPRKAASDQFFGALAGAGAAAPEAVAQAIRIVMGNDTPSLSPPLNSAPAVTVPPSAMPSPAASTGPRASIVDLGRALEKAGLRVREHPEFGGVGGHSDGSLHYKGLALDLTDWQDPGEKEASWGPRKGWLGARTSEILGPSGQVLHPGNDKSHSDHIHLGIPSGSISQEQLNQIVAARQQSLQKYPLRWNG